MTRDEIIAIVRSCAKKLGRNPTVRDLRRIRGFQDAALYQKFRGMQEVLQAAGLEPKGSGFKIPTTALLLDWATVARRLKRLPTVVEYSREGRFSPLPFNRRFGEWRSLPDLFRRFAQQRGIEKPWGDVLGMIGARELAAVNALEPESVAADRGEVDERESPSASAASVPAAKSNTSKQRRFNNGKGQPAKNDVRVDIRMQAGLLRRRLRSDRPVYGAPLLLPALAREPVNEAGVIYIFGMLAERLGFIVERMQRDFPDCEALYEAEPGKWQRLRVEFEYRSRNFAQHRHRARDCDMIVCWIHDWTDCPKELDVVELGKLVKRTG